MSVFLSFYRMPKGTPCFFLIFVGLFCIVSPLPLIPECRSAEVLSISDVNRFNHYSSLEEELLTLINQERSKRELRPLIQDNTLTAIAREHSKGMAQQGFISHDLPFGDLKTRLYRAGYFHEVTHENLASARTVAKAHAALLKSSPHKENILAKDVTRIGIGISQRPAPYSSQLFIAEIFADPRDEYQLTTVQTLLENRVEELRQKGAGSMLSNPILEDFASRSVQSINLPYKRDDLRNLASASVDKLRENDRSQLARLEVEVQIVHNPANLNIPALALDGRARIYGSAVRKITDNNETAFLVLTLIGITP
jgi:hypothetical protein